MRYQLQLLTSLLLFMAACKKSEDRNTAACNDCVTVAGTVHAAPSGVAVGAATVRLSKITGSTIIAQTTADASGHYSMLAERSSLSGTLTSMQAAKAGFIANFRNTDDIAYSTGIIVNDTMHQDLTLYQSATLIVHLQIPATASTPSSIISINNSFDMAPTLFPFLQLMPVVQGGRNIDTTYSITTAGDINTYLDFSVGSQTRRDTVLVPAGTTVHHLVQF